MKAMLKLLWKKSPVKILIFLSSLLAALVYFESLARDLRGQDLVIDINSNAP